MKDAELKVQDRINALIHGTGDDCYTLRNAMQDIMMEDVGIFRNGKDLQDGVNRLQELLERSKNMRLMGNITKGANAELAQALRIPGEIRLALCTAYGALQRTESRGAHTREDYPARNDKDWLVRTLAYWPEGATLPVLKYEPATTKFILPQGTAATAAARLYPVTCPTRRSSASTRTKGDNHHGTYTDLRYIPLQPAGSLLQAAHAVLSAA